MRGAVGEGAGAGEVAEGELQDMFKEVFFDEFVYEDYVGSVGGCAAEGEAGSDEVRGRGGEVRGAVYDCDYFALRGDVLRVCGLADLRLLEDLEAG